jgi:hypothetical protein
MKTRNQLTDAACAAATRLTPDLKNNPLVILALVGVLIDVVRLWMACKNKGTSPSQAAREGNTALLRVATRHARLRLLEQGLSGLHAPRVAEAAVAEIGAMPDDRIRGAIAACEAL